MSNSPNKIVNPFAVNASEIDSYPSETPDTEGFYNSGGWSSGFMNDPPNYKPRGQTFNRLFFELFYRAKDYCVNKFYRYDSTHSTNLGGYPIDATVMGDDGETIYINTVSNNTTNPNSGGSGWKKIFNFIFKGLVIIDADNGSFTLPDCFNNYTVKWGAFTTTTTNELVNVTFASPFAHKCYHVSPMCTGGSDTTDPQNNPYLSAHPSTSGFSIMYSRTGASSFTYLAFGK